MEDYDRQQAEIKYGPPPPDYYQQPQAPPPPKWKPHPIFWVILLGTLLGCVCSGVLMTAGNSGVQLGG